MHICDGSFSNSIIGENQTNRTVERNIFWRMQCSFIKLLLVFGFDFQDRTPKFTFNVKEINVTFAQDRTNEDNSLQFTYVKSDGLTRNYFVSSGSGKVFENLYDIGQFQKISIPNHGRLPWFIPPLPSEIPKCVTPPCPQNSIIVNPPSPSEFPFFWKYIFNLATPIWTNEHEFMPPQGCDLAAPGDKLQTLTYR